MKNIEQLIKEQLLTQNSKLLDLFNKHKQNNQKKLQSIRLQIKELKDDIIEKEDSLKEIDEQYSIESELIFYADFCIKKLNDLFKRNDLVLIPDFNIFWNKKKMILIIACKKRYTKQQLDNLKKQFIVNSGYPNITLAQYSANQMQLSLTM